MGRPRLGVEMALLALHRRHPHRPSHQFLTFCPILLHHQYCALPGQNLVFPIPRARAYEPHPAATPLASLLARTSLQWHAWRAAGV